MAKIRKGDLVEVLAGNERGKRGRVLQVMPDRDRLVVQGINLRWKHLRKSQQNPQGGRVQREMPLHVSNVMLYDEAAGVRSRAGFAVEDGRKVRVLRRTGQPVGAAAEKKPARKKASKKKKAAKAEPESQES